jgi:Tfp pilus assembly protein PilN
VTALLGIGLLLAQGVKDRSYLASVTQSIRSLDQEVKSVEALIEAVERKRRLLATLKSVEGSGTRPLAILRGITEILPADAWLTSLTVGSKGVELTGQASAANQLIPLLENSPLLRNAEFASPVTKGREKEQFRIRALPETPAAQAAALPAATPAAAKPARPPRKAR